MRFSLPRALSRFLPRASAALLFALAPVFTPSLYAATNTPAAQKQTATKQTATKPAPAKPAPAKPPIPSALASEIAGEIELSHSLSANAATGLAVLIERFNKENENEPDAMRIKLMPAGSEKKPSPLNLMTSASAANFLANKETFKPVYQVMQEAKLSLPESEISPNLLFGQDRKRIRVLPLAFTAPVLFYNKRLFKQAGLNPDAPPKTWQEMQKMADSLMDSGVMCPYTSSWPVWVHIDNLSALSGAPIADSKGKLAFNSLIQVKHIAMLASWHKAGFFQNFGRANEADSHFYSNECAIITTNVDANRYFADAPGLEVGVAPLPHHDDLYGGARHTLATGGAIWIGSNYKPKTYKNIARFLRFLLAPNTQIEIARTGSFLPLTETAQDALKSQLLKDEEQSLDIANASLKGQGASEPLRVSSLDPVRIIADEELEQVWADKKPAKAALDTAVKRGNSILAAKSAMRKALAGQ